MHDIGCSWIVFDDLMIMSMVDFVVWFLVFKTYAVHLYSLYRLKTFHRIPINRPIRCVAFAYVNRKFTHILVGFQETDANQPSLMFVFGRNVGTR